MSGDQIKIDGLIEFQKSLRDVDAGIPKMMRLVFNDAGQLVVDWARPRIPQRSGRARASLKARSTQRAGQVSIGGNRAAWVPWLDFGGEGKRKGRPPARPFIREGRYVYQGLRVKRDDITDLMNDRFAELARQAGFDVNG